MKSQHLFLEFENGVDRKSATSTTTVATYFTGYNRKQCLYSKQEHAHMHSQ